jgi:hypothetical protein
MNERIYFNTAEPLDKALFESFLHENLKCNEFIWITNFYEFIVDNEIEKQKTYISFETSTEGFKFHYVVFDRCNFGHTLRERIEILKSLAQKLRIEILSTDDEVNPWSWVFIEPNGETSTVQTKNDNELVVEEFYNFSFGDFRTEDKLGHLEIEQLKALIKGLYSEIQVDYSTDGPIINGDFNKVKDRYEKLKGFENHYEIRPVGKTPWFDKEEKSEQFISMMKEFRKLINKTLCIFPRNFCDVKNIEGGSDSEEYCILLTSSGQEKIIYKQRRKSWLS